jgi:hypothetical protein
MTIEAKLDRIIELLEACNRPAQPPVDNAHVAPGCEKFANPTPASPEKKTRAKPAATAPAPASATAAPPAQTTSVAAATLDDVRVALVTLSSKTGSRAKSDEILAKHNARVTGDLKPEQYAQVVAACQSAG